MNRDLFDALCRLFGDPLDPQYPVFCKLDCRVDANPVGVVYDCELQWWAVGVGKKPIETGYGLKYLMAVLLAMTPDDADLWVGETLGNEIAEKGQRSLIDGTVYA